MQGVLTAGWGLGEVRVVRTRVHLPGVIRVDCRITEL